MALGVLRPRAIPAARTGLWPADGEQWGGEGRRGEGAWPGASTAPRGRGVLRVGGASRQFGSVPAVGAGCLQDGTPMLAGFLGRHRSRVT